MPFLTRGSSWIHDWDPSCMIYKSSSFSFTDINVMIFECKNQKMELCILILRSQQFTPGKSLFFSCHLWEINEGELINLSVILTLFSLQLFLTNNVISNLGQSWRLLTSPHQRMSLADLPCYFFPEWQQSQIHHILSLILLRRHCWKWYHI